jgi:homoserine O-acetyltransferase/O-succinyltransferase
MIVTPWHAGLRPMPTDFQAEGIMNIDPYYSEDIHGPYSIFNMGNFDLESGACIREAKLAYTTFGTLSPARDNAILFPTWYSGTSKIIGQAYIGNQRALDPEIYFIIVANQIGNGLSSSPQNAPPPANGPAFPVVSIGDDVRAQFRLVTEHFGISKLELVLGGSMGAQQTYDWAVRYPDAVRRAAPIAGTARCTAHNRLLVQTFKEAITSDPHWDEGWYRHNCDVRRGLGRHARLFAGSGFSSKLFANEGWRSLGFTSVEDFVTNFVEAHFLPQDSNDLLLMLNKWQNGDVSRMTGGCLKTALAKISARVAVIAIEEDVFFPVADIAEEQRMIPTSEFKLVSSDWGHLALFGIDPGYNAAVDAHLKALLSA